MTERAVTFTARMVNRTTPQVNEVVQGMDRMRAATERVTRVTGAAANTNASWMRGMSQNRRTIQQLGFQITDFTTQVAGGQSPLLAFVQQGGQVLQFFEATGAVLATLLAVFGTMGLVFLRSGQSLATLTPIMGILYDEFVTLTSAVRAFGSFLVDVANVVLNNLDTLLVSAALVGSYFATRWVAAMVRAKIASLDLFVAMFRVNQMAVVTRSIWASVVAVITAFATRVVAAMTIAVTSTFGFVASLFTLHGALTAVYFLMGGPLIEAMVRFIAVVTVGAVSAVLSLYVAMLHLIGAIVTGFVPTFASVVSVLSSFSIAAMFATVRSLAMAAAQRIVAAASTLQTMATLSTTSATFALSAALVYAQVRATVLAFAYRGLLIAVALLTSAFRALMFVVMATGIGALIIGIGALITGFIRAKDALGSWGAVWELVKEIAVETLSRIGTLVTDWLPAKFRQGMNAAKAWFVGAIADMVGAFANLTNTVASGFNNLFGTQLQGIGSNLETTLRGWVNTYTNQADLARNSADNWWDAITMPIDAFNRLREAMSDDSTFDVRDWFQGGGAGGGAVEREADRIAELYKQTARSISDSFKSAFKGLIDGSKSATDVVREMLGSILDRIYDIMMTPVFDNIARMVTGGIFRLTGTPMPTTIPSFAGGGQTRAGVRAGGVDGKGGSLAIMHPNETIVDETVRFGARGGGGAGVKIQNIVNNYGSEPVTQETQRGPDGEMLLITTIGKAIAQGKLDGALSSRMNAKPRTIAR